MILKKKIQAHREIRYLPRVIRHVSVENKIFSQSPASETPLTPRGIIPVRWVGTKYRDLSLRSMDLSMVVRALEGF